MPKSMSRIASLYPFPSAAGLTCLSLPLFTSPSNFVQTVCRILCHLVGFPRRQVHGDWRDQLQVAVRLKWQTPHGWYTFYLQELESKELESQPASGPYRNASALLALLKGQTYPKSDRRTQIHDVRIVDISFDHLSQKINVQECPERETHEPQELTIKDIERELVYRGFKFTAKVFKAIRDGEGRTMCDSCYVVCQCCHESEYVLTFFEAKIADRHRVCEAGWASC